MTKILWHSVHPDVKTGYGQQTALFTPRIRAAGHDVRLSAYFGHDMRMGFWDGMKVYPGDHTSLGKFMLRVYAEDHSGSDDPSDVQVITLMDVWTWIDMRYGGAAAFDGLRMASWVPVDHDPIPPGVHKALTDYAVKPIAMSRFGERALQVAGLDPLYVPHGVETDVYKPNPDGAAELREKFHIPADAFVVGMVANNQGNSPPRKSFPQVILSFAGLLAKHPDAILYLHCDVRGLAGGMNIPEVINLCGIPQDNVRFCSQSRYLTGAIYADEMAATYSMLDVLANPSYGEGFGIPIIEAQACGTPVIVTDWTAMPELVGAGWLVQGDPWYDCAHGSYYKCPAIMEILAAMEAAYEARGDAGVAEAARAKALEYDADGVMTDYWLPALAQLEKAGAPPQVQRQPAKPNRAARRKKATAAA